MQVSIFDAKDRLDELIVLAEAGEDIVLAQSGRPAVRLVPVKVKHDPEARLAAIEALQRVARSKRLSGPSAARSQDFLYDEDGLPA